MVNIAGIKQVDSIDIDKSTFRRQYVGCIVLTHDSQILLQQRPDDWRTFPGMIATFGGHIEVSESPSDAIIRELYEELGAIAKTDELLDLGAVTEQTTRHTELIHLYFWHDKQNTITGCYECEARWFDNTASAFAHPKLMDDVRWALSQCRERGLLERTA